MPDPYPRPPRAALAIVLAAAMTLTSAPAAQAAADTTAPTAPGAPVLSSATPSTVTLTWQGSTDDMGVSAYLVRRALPTGGAWVESTPGATTTITIRDLTPNNGYTFSIVAVDAAGNQSAASPSAGVRTARYTAGTMCSVAYQPGSSGSGSFFAQLGMTNLTTGPWQEWTLAFTLAAGQQINPQWGFRSSGTRWSQTFVSLLSSGAGPLPPGGTRSASFAGTYTGGNPPPTDITINDEPCTVTGVPVPPGRPGNLTASAVTPGSVSLTWTAATPGTDPITGYEVLVNGYRYVCAGVDPLGCLVTGLSPGTGYAFSVRALDTAGRAGPAATIVVQTPAATRTCAVAYAGFDWGDGSGFTANVTITNTGGTPISGWTLRFAFPSGQRLRQGWNATWTQPPSSPDVTAVNLGWNAVIAPGASTTVGFNGGHDGANARPVAFTVNDAPCAIS